MKKSEAKPGTKVIASIDESSELLVRYSPNDNYTTLVGTIINRHANHQNEVWVKWIDGYFGELEEEEVDIDLLALESDRSKVEEQFNLVSKEIQAKMKEAAKLVKEANAIAKKNRFGPLADMYDAVHPLINAMDNSGWRSSSWGC